MVENDRGQDSEIVVNWVLDQHDVNLYQYGDIHYIEELGLTYSPHDFQEEDFLKLIAAEKEYETELTEDGVVVYKTSTIDEIPYQRKVGVTFSPERIPLGGVDKPIQDGEPIDDTTRETLRLLSKYYIRKSDLDQAV